MKKVIIFAFMLFAMVNLKEQAPQGIPYQAVARAANGSILQSTHISLRFTVYKTSTSGPIVYQETYIGISTNALGLFNVNIGSGTPVTGIFSAIPWGTYAIFLQTEMDPAGGTNYQNMGPATQLMSVPYSLYSATSGTSGSATSAWNLTGNNGTNPATNFIGNTDGQGIAFKVFNLPSGFLGGISNPNTSFGYIPK